MTLNYLIFLSQIWKQKGEEFRLHGQWGWRWISATRPLGKLDARICGLRAGPWRIVSLFRGNFSLCDLEDFVVNLNLFLKKDDGTFCYVQCDPVTDEDEIYKIPSNDPAMEVVDVCGALNDAERRVYPKIAKKGKLDSMLQWRLQSKSTSVKNVHKPKTSSKSKKRSIFFLPGHELRHLARQFGQGYVDGFDHRCHPGRSTKSTSWIYPSARPLFKTCWFFRTNCLQSLSAAALQLRILWASVRWEGMADIEDGQPIQTTLIDHRHVGRFSERTQYFERRVAVPLGASADANEVSQSRTRRFTEEPKLSSPIVTEEWVDEDQLDLCLIRRYHERIERESTASSLASSSIESRPTPGQEPVKPATTDELKPNAQHESSVHQTTAPTMDLPSSSRENETVETTAAAATSQLVAPVTSATAATPAAFKMEPLDPFPDLKVRSLQSEQQLPEIPTESKFSLQPNREKDGIPDPLATFHVECSPLPTLRVKIEK